MKRVSVCLLTYDRFEYAERTLQSLLENLSYDGPLGIHIADDGSPGDDTARLVEIAEDHPRELAFISVTNAERGGYGRSFNLAAQVIHPASDYIIPLEDDWELTREFDLDALIVDMEAMEEVEAVRLGYIGFTQELRGKFVSSGHRMYLLLDPDSPEPHVFAGHPRIETVEYQKAVGEWTEGINAGATEFDLSQRREAREGVAWPVDLVLPRGDLFAHIGTVQARDDQREKVEAE